MAWGLLRTFCTDPAFTRAVSPYSSAHALDAPAPGSSTGALVLEFACGAQAAVARSNKPVSLQIGASGQPRPEPCASKLRLKRRD